MIKRLLAVLLLGAALAGAAHADVIDRRTGQIITKDGLTYSGVPVWAFKFDDGRDQPYDDELYKAFVDKGIPISFSINPGLLSTDGTGSKITKEELLEIYRYGWQPNGPDLVEIAHHTWSGLDPNSTGDSDDMTWEQIERELDRDWYLDELGVSASFIAFPGGADPTQWRKRHRGVLMDLMRREGWSYGNLDESNANPDSAYTYSFAIHDIPTHTAAETPQRTDAGIKPGMIRNPYNLPNSLTLDLGSHFIERGQNQYGDRAGSRGVVNSWLVREKEDNTTTLDDSEVNALWDNSVNFQFHSLVARGDGSIFSLHAEDDADATVAGGEGNWYATNTDGLVHSDDADQYSDHMNVEAIARLVKALWDEGLIVPVTLSEFGEWATSTYAPGTNLLDWNRDMKVSQVAAADTFGIHYMWIGGLGSNNFQGANWETNAQNIGNGSLTEIANDGGRYDSGWDGSAVVDSNGYVSRFNKNGYGWQRSVLGIRMNGFTEWAFNLPPGNYEFAVQSSGHGTNTEYLEYTQSLVVQKVMIASTFANQGGLVYDDSLFHMTSIDTTSNVETIIGDDNLGDGQWGSTMAFWFEIPARLPYGAAPYRFPASEFGSTMTALDPLLGTTAGSTYNVVGQWLPVKVGLWGVRFRHQDGNAVQRVLSYPTLTYTPLQ